MWLWNRLMPVIFGLHAISFWQALGLLVLSKILFGGFRGRPGFGGDWRPRLIERWDSMTPEEREKFRAHGIGQPLAVGDAALVLGQRQPLPRRHHYEDDST